MTILRTFLCVILLAGLVLLAYPPGLSAEPLTPVSLQLRWRHQFQFAGYYAALHKGFYREAGLEVTLKEGGPGADPVADVLAGRSDFGIGVSSLVIDYLKGKPVLLLGPVFQHSPNILIVHGRNQSPDNLARPGSGKPKIALMGGDQDVELKAIFLNEGISLDKLQIVPDKNHLEDFLNQHVDALNAYMSNEPFVLNQRGIPHTILRPQTYGMDFYGDLLFTRTDLEKSRPDVVAAFRAASMKGWQYALDRPREIIDLILEQYNSQQKSREHLAYEAREISRLINAEVIEIGHNNPGRWNHIADTYQRFGIVDLDRPLNDFFYQQDQKADFTRLYWIIAISVGVMLVTGGIAFFIHRINRRLGLALEEKSRSEERHRVIFQTSASAGIVWREGFIITDWNRQAEAVFGWKREEVLGRRFVDFLLPTAEYQRMEPELSQMVWDDILPHSINDNLTRDGRVITCEWFNAWLPERPGDPREVVSLAIDITERRQSEAALAELTRSLESLSITDCLTGLANRRHFDEVLNTEYGRHVRSGGELSLIMLDIDHFKAFNDTYGHLKGDDCLREVGRVLRETVSRAADLAARYGGEEFACILPDTDRNGAVIVAEQIRRGIEALSVPHSGSSVADHVTASLGVITAPCEPGGSPQQIIARADQLLYQAKATGRNRIQFVACSNPSEPREEVGSGLVRLVWHDSFCSGTPLLDAQHQRLFQAANDLFSALLSGRPAAETAPFIFNLLADVKRHFEDERKILEQTAFPGLQQHLDDHDRLLARGGELIEQFEAGTLSVGVLFQFLAYDVIMIHMLGADREYFPFVSPGNVQQLYGLQEP